MLKSSYPVTFVLLGTYFSYMKQNYGSFQNKVNDCAPFSIQMKTDSRVGNWRMHDGNRHLHSHNLIKILFELNLNNVCDSNVFKI